MPESSPPIRLLHMRDFARKALALVRGRKKEDIDKDEVLQLALTRLVELIGEAGQQMPPIISGRNFLASHGTRSWE